MFDLKTIQSMNKEAEKGKLPAWYRQEGLKKCHHDLQHVREDLIVCRQCGSEWSKKTLDSKPNIL